MLNNNSEFLDVNNVFDNDAYNKYRLNKMLDYKDTVDYDVKFYLSKKDDKWELDEPDRVVLEKIHGMYDYEKN